MRADVNIKSYYLQFINNAISTYGKHRKTLAKSKEHKEELIKYLEENKVFYKYHLNIDLDAYNIEWTSKKFDKEESLFKHTVKLLKSESDTSNRSKIIQVIKYCHILKSIHSIQTKMDFSLKCKNMKFREFEEYVHTYYNKVNEVILRGDGYRFSNGIGTYVCNYWKFDLTLSRKNKHLDRRATAIRKKELKDKGVKLYNANEAHWYKVRGIPYDGVDYRVYLDKDYFYEFTIIHSKLMPNSNVQFELVDTINKKFRGMSHQELAKKFVKTESDVHNIQVDPRVKLNLLNIHNPNIYLNFVRNSSMYKYEDGPHK